MSTGYGYEKEGRREKTAFLLTAEAKKDGKRVRGEEGEG